MRIIEQTQTENIALTDQLIIDGEMVGTRAITFAKALEDINKQIGWKALYGETIPVEVRRNIFRGKNLGSQVTDEQYATIADGSFRDLYIGDYWEIDNNRWRIVDINYWIGAGDQECTTPHLVIMPDISLVQAKMNDTDTTQGGYIGSQMASTKMAEVLDIVRGVFVNEHILIHREIFSNAVTDGIPTGVGWYGNTIALPNEVMLSGSYMVTMSSKGTTVSIRYTANLVQLALMKKYPKYINSGRESFWLRDVASDKNFAVMHYTRHLTALPASRENGVRPVFGVMG